MTTETLFLSHWSERTIAVIHEMVIIIQWSYTLHPHALISSRIIDHWFSSQVEGNRLWVIQSTMSVLRDFFEWPNSYNISWELISSSPHSVAIESDANPSLSDRIGIVHWKRWQISVKPPIEFVYGALCVCTMPYYCDKTSNYCPLPVGHFHVVLPVPPTSSCCVPADPLRQICAGPSWGVLNCR